MNQWNRMILLIPALNPDEKLVSYVRACIAMGWKRILLVDDGSDAAHRQYFTEAEKEAAVTVLHHSHNMGKGRALKTGLSYCLSHFPDSEGVVTADSDGQHSPEDTRRVAEALAQHPNHLVLGCRDFNEPQVPFKSRYGNKITTLVFQLFYGRRINDTQTGLRGIGRSQWATLCRLQGDRFEYEIKMLIELVRKDVPFLEVKIETIYIDDNSESHFRPVKDSAKIYGVILGTFLKYTLSSLCASLIDLGVFAILSHAAFSDLPLGKNVLYATVWARVASSVYNFFCNKKMVFGMRGNILATALRYYLLAAVLMLSSAGLVYCFTRLLSCPQIGVKMIVDVCLFFISYRIQQKFVFAEKAEREYDG